MKKIFSVNLAMADMPKEDFLKWHKTHEKKDSLTGELRYKKLQEDAKAAKAPKK